ncbi:enoyl-CoA hydratase-related protein [Salipiger mucosus]|uniref:Methylglutaconyl-CoA hydratase n=1 Tax=Salipiger mucosus DSM 16094 TaxID=1123237 RepID=S9QVK0_9RHOB|nr:enoyl-CoA hydratase-related protein [Salipiger mucosus]EPX83598.1 Methylglutaconyl-CoA hydratase [Salipiger mucosus DSM 16094]
MSHDSIRVTRDARGLATVTLARPEKHNAMNAAMIAELSEAAERTCRRRQRPGRDPYRRGRSFCAGGDLGWMRAQAEKDRAGKVQEAQGLARMLGLWNRMPKPVIGQVHGAAYGGGIGLIAVCDIVVAEENTRFALTETRLGLIPATIGPFVVSRMGEAFARQVFFTARPFDAAFLMRAGMVARICPADGLAEAVEDEVSAVLDCAPGAVSAAKSLCRDLSGPEPMEAGDMTANALADRWETEEAQEGIAAFFAKKTPSWRQRA